MQTTESVDSPEDLSEAIAACEAEMIRLSLHKRHPSIVMWLYWSGHEGEMERLVSREDFIKLYRYLKKCKP
jgi:hypothetical protein